MGGSRYGAVGCDKISLQSRDSTLKEGTKVYSRKVVAQTGEGWRPKWLSKMDRANLSSHRGATVTEDRSAWYRAEIDIIKMAPRFATHLKRTTEIRDP